MAFFFFINIFLENFTVIFSTLQPSKVIEILLSREPPKGFYDVSCCYFTPLEFSISRLLFYVSDTSSAKL